MTVTQILSELERRGVRLEAVGDRLRYRPKDAVPAEMVEVLRAHKEELLQALRELKVKARVRGQDAVIQSTEADVCFHCKGKKVCHCALCAIPAPRMRWADGQCRACLGTGALAWPERVQ